MPRNPASGIPILTLASLLALVAPARSAAAEVSYVKDVKPFLAKYCVECHTQAKAHGGVALDSYQALVRGNDPVIRPNQPDRSDLVRVLSASAGRKLMPPARKARPTAEEIAMIREWVKAGGRDDTEGDKKDEECRLLDTTDFGERGCVSAPRGVLGALTQPRSRETGH